MKQRADGTWDRSDTANRVLDDYNLTKLIKVMEDLKNAQNTTTKTFEKYYSVSASHRSDISLEYAIKHYLPILKNIQAKGGGASNLSEKDIADIKSATNMIGHNLKVLSVARVKQDKLRDSSFAKQMEGFRRAYYDAMKDVYTRDYKRDEDLNPNSTSEKIAPIKVFNQEANEFVESLKEIRKKIYATNATWSEGIDASNEYKGAIAIQRYRASMGKKLPYDAEPYANFSNLSFNSNTVEQASQQENLTSKALNFYKGFDLSLFLGGMNIITKDLPAIHGAIRALSDVVNSFKAGSRIGRMFSEATGITDTKDGVMDKALGMAARGVGSAIGGALGGAAGAAIGGVAGMLVSKAITDDLGGPLATITGGIAAIVSTIGMMWKMMKKSSPILQAVEDLFNLAMILFFLPFGNALGTIFLPILETIIEFALLFNEMITPFLEPIAEAIAGFISVVLGAMLELLEALLPYIVPIMTILGELIAAPIEILTGWVEWIKNNSDEIKAPLDIFKYFFTTDFQEKLKEIVGEKIARVIENGGKIVNFLADIIGIIKIISNTIQSVFKPIGETVGGAVESAKDFVKPGWDYFTGGGLVGWSLRKLGIKPFATGGIVTSPTLSLIGERGPEAVVPLNEANGIGATYVVNINGDVYGISDLESRIERVIQRTANKSYYR